LTQPVHQVDLLTGEVFAVVVGQIGLGNGRSPLEFPDVGCCQSIDDVEKGGQRKMVLADEGDLVALADAKGDVGEKPSAVFGLFAELFNIEDLITNLPELFEDD